MKKTIKDECGMVFLRLLGEKPYNKITVRDIANGAEISTVTFYKYFTSKGDLFYWCVHEDGKKSYEKLGNSYTWRDYIQDNLILNSSHISRAVNLYVHAEGYDSVNEVTFRSNYDLMTDYIIDKFGENVIDEELMTAMQIYLIGCLTYMGKVIRENHFNPEEIAQYITDSMPAVLRKYIPC